MNIKIIITIAVHAQMQFITQLLLKRCLLVKETLALYNNENRE